MSKPSKKSPSENKTEIFVSYSHKDEKWKDMLQPHLEILKHYEGISYWDDRQIGVGDDWYSNIEEGMKNAKVAICLISANYLASGFIRNEEVPYLLDKLRKKEMLLIPILVDDCSWEFVPWLRSLQMIPRDGECLAIDYEGKESKILKQVAISVQKHIGEVSEVILVQEVEGEPIPKWVPLSEKDIDITRLPMTGAELFGRNDELNKLDKFWESEATNVVSFVAWGGVGKSTLINKWLRYMEEENYRGAKRVFGWSFYSQGTNDKVTSADQFIRKALEWFGDDNPDEGSAWDKGKRLGKLIGEEKNLLVLDGMEPLQSGLKEERGKIKDPALEMMLKQLTKKNKGLCVITTRETLPNMDKFGNAYQEVELDQISKEAGRALLRVKGVRGTDFRIEKAVEKFGNHALAINLLGSYLHDIPGHSISEANKIKRTRFKDKKSKHPRRVIQAWEKRLGEGPELNILRIMGLFDRPADEYAIKALRQKPVINNLTSYINSDKKYLVALSKLRSLNLIAEASQKDFGGLDAHPIIRQHFAEQIKNNFSDTWVEANNRLYQYYKNMAKEFPDTLEEMQPLFFAVAHGCLAEKYQEAFDEVYIERISRRNKFYTTRNLGAFGADLAILRNFFEEKLSKPVSHLNKNHQALINNLVGFRLKSLGFIIEAVQPMKTALEIRESSKLWENAAINAGNLSELYLIFGNLKLATYYAQKGVKYSDQSDSELQKMLMRTTLADVLIHMNKMHEAEKLLVKAEKIRTEWQPEICWLYGLEGFRYCNLLLEKKRIKEAIDRAEYSIKIAEKNGWLVNIALGVLTIGKGEYLKALQEEKPSFSQADKALKQAIYELRKAGHLDYLPHGLIARAELYRAKEKWNDAQDDLDEVFDISESSGMRLHECDAHLEQARLYLAQGKKDEAKPHVESARKLIEDTGYHRRDSALKELEELVN